MKQFKIVTFISILVLLINAHAFFAQEQENVIEEKSQTEFAEKQDSNLNEADNKAETIFQCQMDLEVLSNIPGRCSKCGLTLKEYTLEEVISNLNEDGHKRPELKIKMITMVETVEDTLTEDIVDTLNDSIPSIDFSEFDHFGNGMVYQCPNCPEQVWTEEKKCLVCGSYFIELTLEEAEANWIKKHQIKKPEE